MAEIGTTLPTAALQHFGQLSEAPLAPQDLRSPL